LRSCLRSPPQRRSDLPKALSLRERLRAISRARGANCWVVGGFRSLLAGSSPASFASGAAPHCGKHRAEYHFSDRPPLCVRCNRPPPPPPSPCNELPSHSITSSATASRLGDFETQRLGRLEINHGYGSDRLLTREFPAPGAPQNAIDVVCRAPSGRRHQSFAPRSNRAPQAPGEAPPSPPERRDHRRGAT
jgi:hypothetical protein